MTSQIIAPQEASLSEESSLALEPEFSTENIKTTAEGFLNLNLSEELLKALSEMNFSTPSEIQSEAIPKIMLGDDIIAKAPTGSGKTAAFAIPIIEMLDSNPENKTVQALVLCPTRELAIQVHKEFEKLTKFMDSIAIVSVYGGQSIDKQLNALKKSPQIIVATPGRLMDHLRRGSVRLDFVKTVILDEADEMLDMGFRDDINAILDQTSMARQTVLFSATMAKNIVELMKKIQKSPIIVDVTDNLQNAPNIEQSYYIVSENDKIELLTRLIDFRNVKLGLVFCNTKSNVDKVVESLKSRGYFSDALHGDLNQSQREKVMRGFRGGSIDILVATDVAGRGIDVKNVEAVFNYDLPRDDEDYIHRIGRTARAGSSGVAFSFISKKQVQNIKKIERANGIKIDEKTIPSFEEIESSNYSAQIDVLRDIVNKSDLSEYKNRITAMIDENMSSLDIAAAFLKLSMDASAKKINKNIVFHVSDEADSNRRSRSRGDRNRNNSRGNFRGDSRGSRDNRRSKGFRNDSDNQRNKPFDNGFSKPISSDELIFLGNDKPKKRKNRAAEIDEMIMAVKSISNAEKKKPRSRSNSDAKKSFNKFSPRSKKSSKY